MSHLQQPHWKLGQYLRVNTITLYLYTKNTGVIELQSTLLGLKSLVGRCLVAFQPVGLVGSVAESTQSACSAQGISAGDEHHEKEGKPIEALSL